MTLPTYLEFARDHWPYLGRTGKLNNDTTLLTDTATLATIRNFISAEKPASLNPVDILHIVYLMTRKAEDHSIFDSQQTLARGFNVDVKTIVRSQKRLAKVDYLARPQRRGRTNLLSLNILKIPSEAPLLLKITQDAKDLTLRYQTALRKAGQKRFHKNWLAQQFPSAQRLLNECGGDLDLTCWMLGYAMTTPPYISSFMKSLYHLAGRWPKIAAGYAVLQQQRQDLKAMQESQELQQGEVAA